MRSHQEEPLNVLLFEDSPGAVRLTREVLPEARVDNTPHAFTDEEEVQADPGLADTPIVILAGSRTESDTVASHDVVTNAYQAKPISPEEYGSATVRLPGTAR